MAGPDNNPLTKNWLVKSSTKILGPFTREEVLELLTKRQITIIDEIRQPEGRWNYIRENRHFKEIVKNLRYEDENSREDTMTSTMTSTATHGTQTMTKTENPAVVEDEFTLTPTPSPSAPPSTSQPVPAKPVIKDVTPSKDAEAKISKAAGPAKSFGNLQDQRVQNKIQKQNIFLRALLLSIVACAAVFLVYNYLKKDRRSDLGYNQLLASALKYKELGLYERSLENYKRAVAIKEPDLESQFKMVFLLINQDRQSLNGRRIAERASLKEGRSTNDIVQGHLAVALSYMMEGDFSQAENYFQKALSLDANNRSAKFNMATISFKNGNFPEALADYEELSKTDSPIYPVVLLYRAMAMIEIVKAANQIPATDGGPSASAVAEAPGIEQSQKLVSEMKAFAEKSHFMRKELALMMIYLEGMAHTQENRQKAVELFLNEPYDFSDSFVKDPTLDWRNAEWDYLEKYCSDIFTAESTAEIKAVRAVCLIESNRDMEATKLLDETVAEAPKKASTVNAQALYQWKLGRLNEAKLLFQNSEYKNSPLALYIQGEVCLKNKDTACAESAYKSLEKKDENDVVPSYGLAKLKSEQKDKSQALSLIKTGFEKEKNFIPLIELREKLESL